MWIFKECTKCKEEKLLDEFAPSKSCLFGKNNHCKKCTSDYFKLHKEKNRESYKNRNKLNANKLSEKLKTDSDFRLKKTKYQREYKRNRTANDIDFRNKCNIRNLVKSAIKRRGYKKNTKTFDILGCEYEAFKAYLESMFKPGMTWENHGEWHIDHIYPVSRADNEKHLIELNHYTNLQPLWAGENFSKGNRI